MIFAVPISDDNPTVSAPILTFALIGTCIGAFLWQLGHDERVTLYTYGMVPAELFGLWHPPRSQAFATAPPSAYRRSSYGGSVPQAGRRPMRLRSPWE